MPAHVYLVATLPFCITPQHVLQLHSHAYIPILIFYWTILSNIGIGIPYGNHVFCVLKCINPLIVTVLIPSFLFCY
jgi:hypothetical protein